MKKFFKWIFIIFIVLIVIGYLAGNKDDAQNDAGSTQTEQTTSSEAPAAPVAKAKPQKEIYETTARQLFKDYDENEVAFDEKIKGKLVAVTGVVQSIDKDFTDSIVITLKTDNQFMPARMSMNDSEKATAMSLKKGKQVVIVCERMSRMVGAPSGRKCTFK